MAIDVLFKKGTVENFTKLSNKVATTFYLVEDSTADTKDLYIGDVLLSNGADVAANSGRISALETASTTQSGDITSIINQLKILLDADNITDNTSSISQIANDVVITKVGDLTKLTTTKKDTLVNAINEINSVATTAKSTADDAADDVTALYVLANATEATASALKTFVGEGYNTDTLKEYIDAVAGSGIDPQIESQVAANTKAISELKTTVSDGDESLQAQINQLIGTDTNLSIRSIVDAELATQLIPENASESLDTLQEIASWIQSHPDDASAMNDEIVKLQALVGTIPTSIKTGQTTATPDYTSIADWITSVNNSIPSQVEDNVNEKLGNINNTVEQAATTGLYLKVVQTAGKVTAISGYIPSETYDAYGAGETAAAAVQANLITALTWGEF